MKKVKIVKDKTFTLSGLKNEIKYVERAFDKLLNIKSYKKELSGIKGVDEYSSVYFVLFGNDSKVPNPEEYEKDLNEFVESLPEVLTKENFPFDKAKELFEKHIPIEDNRITEEEDRLAKIKREEFAKQVKLEKEEREREIGLLAEEPETVTKRDDQMFVTITAYYDDSDMMTDYYAPHCRLSDIYVIEILPKGRQTENKLRSIIEKHPELRKYNWEWHTENWSMGHGNYCQSSVVGKIKKNAYDGRTEVDYWYELQYFPYTKELPASKFYNKKGVEENVY